VYVLVREALFNAFRDSNASDIEIELEYAARYPRVLVRDNGDGIEPQVLHARRTRHSGLSERKELSERIDMKLRVLSHAGAGTGVELLVPAQIAFESRVNG
jgi:nitrate/nitrite-specific signal transduction histidine kinase